MTQPLEHSFEILRTEFIAEKDNCEIDGISIELLDSTCLYNYPMNRNNVLGGNNLIYLNGSYITFYNFFQNNKQFASAVSPYKPIGMVSNSIGRGNVAIVAQNPNRSQMYISIYSFCEEYVPNHIIKKELTFIDIVMIRATYLVLAVYDHVNKEYIVYIFNSKIVFSVSLDQQKVKRLICQDDKIYVVFEAGGMYLLDHQKFIEKVDIQVQHGEKNIDDYCEIDNEAKIILYGGNKLYCYWFESEKEFILEFNELVNLGENCRAHRIIKVGRNILIAHRNALCISHFVLGDDNIVFVGNHTYPEKIKGGIVSIQSSQDQMHAALAVEVAQKQQTKIQNFIFNLSSISKSHKFINPFTRLMSNGNDCGLFCTMENVLSSNSYLLIGSKIYNLFYSSTLERKKVYNLYETPKFMTVHPFGHQFLCGFDNIIKFYNKIEKDMQEIWSEQYICTAAKYSKSGGLVLSCIEDSSTSLIIYDSYNFRKVKNIPISFMKIYPTKIDWVSNNSHLVLYTSNEILKINVFTGEKVSQFKDKDRVKDKEKEKEKKDYMIKCIDYDGYSDRAIFATNATTGNLVIASKGETGNHSLNLLKAINFPEEISCIKINQSLKTIFFGCKSGTLYWSNYPVKTKSISDESQPAAFILLQYEKLKLHSLPITSIDHTNNNKFMIVNIKSQGYFSFRVRKMKSKDSNAVNMNIIFQELGNPILNTIETSSTINYTNNKEKLKISLEKRKECFNDLEEFRREWEIKSSLSSKQIQIQRKKNELSFINESLAKIEDIKGKKKTIQIKINQIVEEIMGKKEAKEQSYAKQMLELYKEQDENKAVLEEKKKMYNEEFQSLLKECDQNLKQIEKDMTAKRNLFHKNYHAMVKNLENFQRRYQFQKEEEPRQKQLEIKEHLKNLEINQIELTKMSNDLSVKIAQCRKHYERYCNRKLFLEYKNIFFGEQNVKCNHEKTKLLDLKEKLENQLKQLEMYTDKKEKKLRIYLKANEALRKYKQIHQNLSENAVRETEFIKLQQQKVDHNIVAIQKELSTVASCNETADKEIEKLSGRIGELKQDNVEMNKKMKDIGYYLKQILAAMDDVGYCSNEAEREEKLRKIYNYFYVERSVEQLIEMQTKNERNYHKNLLDQKNEKLKTQQSKILNELKNQKDYILNNIEVFKNYNKRINGEINLNYLQIQAQNYNLIAECNLRKEQTSNKKKALHQLIDSVKETQIYLDEIKKQQSDPGKRLKKDKKVIKTHVEVPFVIFQRQKEQKATHKPTGVNNIHFSHFRPASHKIYASNPNSNATKLLDIRSLGESEEKIGFRRIQTAKHKKDQKSEKQNWGVMKPLTATLKKRFGRDTLKSALSMNKSSSKPSTCATYSRAKNSIAH